MDPQKPASHIDMQLGSGLPVQIMAHGKPAVQVDTQLGSGLPAHCMSQVGHEPNVFPPDVTHW
jgi:hypothetical protein